MEKYVDELDINLKAVVQKFKEEIKGVRSNRPSAEIVENVSVSAYGQFMPIKQLGSITVGQAREIVITLWDKEVINPVVKAIEDAKIGLSIKSEGLVIRCFLPALSEERRQEFMKLVKRISEDSRIQIRAKRDETMKKIKAAEESGELNEDMVFKGKEKVQKAVDSANAEIEKNLDAKIKELGE